MLLQTNHFPGTWHLGRKDKLYTNLAKAKRMRGAFFDVIPKFYILPRDRQELLQHTAANPDQLYIQKVSFTAAPCLTASALLVVSPPGVASLPEA